MTDGDQGKAWGATVRLERKKDSFPRHGAGESVHWGWCSHTDLKKERKGKASLFVCCGDTGLTLVGSYETKNARMKSE